MRYPTKNHVPTNAEMREAFNSCVGGNNFMTPTFYQFVYSLEDPSIISEITHGHGMHSNVVAGVTVVKILPDGTVERMRDLSDCFVDSSKWRALTLAKEYAESLTA